MRALLLFLMIATIAAGASAQSVKYSGDEPTWVMINDSIVGALVLTPGQQKMLHDMEVRYQEEHDDILAQKDELENEEVNQRLAALAEKREREIELIMSPEQYRQWVSFRSSGAKTSMPPH